MVPENCEVFDPDHTAQVGFILLADLGKDRDLHESLLHELVTALGYLQSQKLFSLMIKYLYHLSKWALIYRLNNLISVSDMVSDLIPVELTNLN